jgi:hypothetical protein
MWFVLVAVCVAAGAHHWWFESQPPLWLPLLTEKYVFLIGWLPQVRITAVNKVRNYISYAMSLLEEKGHSAVVLKGMGKAINKTVVVGEARQ